MQLVNGEDDNILVERLLWKIGFNAARYESEYDHFRRRLSDFNETLLKINEIKSENDRASIRSAGVNLFVSLEHILEEILSYNVWLLSSDHFLDTKFVFDIQVANQGVARVLGDSRDIATHSVTWNKNGGNTLGTLLVYLSAANDWIRSLSNKDKEEVKRKEEDLPHFVEEKERVFPFLHVELWADSVSEELTTYSVHFGKVVDLFAKSNLAEIRNGLDHKRTDVTFPTVDLMLACCARLLESFNLADMNRLIPKTYWLSQYNKDMYGRVELEARDYRERQINLYGPSGLAGMPTINFDRPTIIPSGNLLGLANSEIPIVYQEASAYSTYWHGYPRRRFIPERENPLIVSAEPIQV